jgi:predicted ester cyclase
MERFLREVWEDKKLDLLPEFVKEDATLYFEGDILSGINSIREYIGAAQKAFPDLRYEIADLFFDGDKIAMRYIGSATHQGKYEGKHATGNKISYEGIVIYHMDGDRVAEGWVQSDWVLKFRSFELDRRPNIHDKNFIASTSKVGRTDINQVNKCRLTSDYGSESSIQAIFSSQ